jgi:hypothetical protein
VKLSDYERSPEFQKRAAAIADDVRATLDRVDPINLGDIARALSVPPAVAAAWLIAEFAIPAGETVTINVTGWPQ